MKFADIQGQRQEARPGHSGMCPSCGAAVVAKCGDHRVWHWAHRGVRMCDQWWEPETEWHRNWKNHFPVDWQEVVQVAQSGERHVADVKTASGMVIEFQHSFLKEDERMAREVFYRKMVWVVDGRRRKRDADQLLKSLGPRLFGSPPFIFHIATHEESALLRDWNASSVPVYFDLGAREESGTPIFWRRDPVSRSGRAYLTPVSCGSFLKVHREGIDAEEKLSEGIGVVVDAILRSAEHPQPLPRHPQYLANRSRFPRR